MQQSLAAIESENMKVSAFLQESQHIIRDADAREYQLLKSDIVLTAE